MTHYEHIKLQTLAIPCNPQHLTFNGRCLNCGFNMLVVKPMAKSS